MDLVSIAPATRTVALGRAAVEVSGLSLRRLTQLIVEYPDLLAFAGGGTVDLLGLLARAPEMALAIFAVGVVGPAPRRRWRIWRREIAEGDLLRAFDAAATGQQLDILACIVELTFAGQRGAPFLRSVLAGVVPGATAEASSEPPTSDASMPSSSSG